MPTQLVDGEGTSEPQLFSAVVDVLAAGAISSVFQPIVELESGAVVAYEALARGPKGPLESPDALFRAARQEGVLSSLDKACRAAAFRGAARLGLFAPLTVFVNVEPEVLDLAPLSDLLAISDEVAGNLRIIVEITERALATRPAELLRTVEKVRSLGWGVALDDVGAEPASLAFMSLLSPDVVKLDLDLVQGVPSPHTARVVHAVNAYAERSGALVLAEGIENERHLEAAHALGATLGQGWHFGVPAAAPVAPREVTALALSTEGVSADPVPLVSPFACLPEGTALRRAPKRTLIEFSKQLEREALRLGDTCVVASSFQYRHHFTPPTALRYASLAQHAGFVCAIGEGLPAEPIPGVRGASLHGSDPMMGEWDVTVLSPHFSAALLARDLGDSGPDMDRVFEYVLTYRRDTVVSATQQMLLRVAAATNLR